MVDRISVIRKIIEEARKAKTINLTWQKCGSSKDKHWCSFESLELPIKSKTFGVYVIWHEGDPPHTVDVGQGDISDRLAKHRTERKILRHRKRGKLRATWASVDKDSADGVERYLADTLKPLEGRRWPDADPIPVNLPDFMTF